MRARPEDRAVAVWWRSRSIRSRCPRSDFIDAERRAAIRDLVAENLFSPGGRGGAFRLRLSIADRKLVLDVTDDAGTPVVSHVLSLTPLRAW